MILFFVVVEVDVVISASSDTTVKVWEKSKKGNSSFNVKNTQGLCSLFGLFS
ncbi:unnamed protein product [Meloidogyne enterolobii]|uniref:Uncharacterized protein n=1 Tax=Meloidogyne enterolobii TaxID=390850 RepID=A0ACB1A560_MELEN